MSRLVDGVREQFFIVQTSHGQPEVTRLGSLGGGTDRR